MGGKPRSLPERKSEAAGPTVPRAAARPNDGRRNSPPILAGEDERLQEMRRAILFGDDGRVRALLDGGVEPSTRGKDGHTLLCTAIMEGSDSVATLVIDRAQSLEARCEEASHHGAGSTPLCGAVFRGRVDLVKLLVERGARVDAVLRGGMGALHTAAFVGRAATIPVLVHAGADVNARSERRLTPLHYAAHRGQLNAARALISHGAEVDAEIVRGTTALTLAVAAEQFEVAHLLIRAGANADRIFQAAAGSGHLHIVDLLIDADAKVLRQPAAIRAAKAAAQTAGNRELAELLESIDRFPVAAVVARRLEKRAQQNAVATIYKQYTSNSLPYWVPMAELEARVEELSERIGAAVCKTTVERRTREMENRGVLQLAAGANPDMAHTLADQLIDMAAAAKAGSPPKGIDLEILEKLVDNLRERGKL